MDGFARDRTPGLKDGGPDKEISWKRVCAEAEFFHLDAEEFGKLEEFFLRIDGDFLRLCASAPPGSFPMDRVREAFSGADVKKFLLLCIVANGENLRELYRREGWPPEMLSGIAADLGFWKEVMLRDFGHYGLDERIFGWEQECLNGTVKSFGRLQGNDLHSFLPRYSVYRRTDGKLTVMEAFRRGNPPRPDLVFGDKVINIHIPASGPLDIGECIRSLRRMRDFSAKYHPDYDYRAVVCYSWLLDECFRELLPENSRIVRFQNLGHILPLTGVDQTEEVRWRIWGRRHLATPPEKLPRSTSLEKSVAEHLMNGGCFQEGLLIIFKDELEEIIKTIPEEDAAGDTAP